MKLLFDVTHPAHVHLFRHAIRELQADGHEVRITAREKDLTNDLLDSFGFEYDSLSRKGERKLDLLVEWSRRELRMVRLARRFEPDVVVSRLNPPAAHAATAVGAPAVVFDDSERARFAAAVTHPFADVVCTPTSYTRDLGAKQRRYDGFHELAYLHPDRFEPDPEPLAEHGIDVETPYTVLRFVSWGAHHDVGEGGFSDRQKRRLVDALSEYGAVYVTSERELPPELEDHRLPIPPEYVHDLLYYADLYVGDSQTMATEAGVLGTPSVRANSFGGAGDMGNFETLAEYGLVHSTPDTDRAISLATDLAERDTETEWRDRRRRLCAEKIDVTSYIIETIETVGR